MTRRSSRPGPAVRAEAGPRRYQSYQHFDHWQALQAVAAATGAPTAAHPVDADPLPVKTDRLPTRRQRVAIGEPTLTSSTCADTHPIDRAGPAGR